MSLEALSFTESITEPDIFASIAALPTEDDLPYDDGAPKETAVHRDQMWTLIYSLQMYWADRPQNYVSGNMFLYYDPQNLKKFRGPDFFVVLDVEERQRKSWAEGRAEQERQRAEEAEQLLAKYRQQFGKLD